MQLPHFSLFRFGTVAIAKKNSSYPLDSISAYEFEFYTEDHPGGSIADGKFRPVRKGHYNLFRPGQRQKLVAHYKCYFINIVTQDPQLCDFFDQLPDSAPLWDMDAVVTLIQRMMSTEDKRSLAGRMQLQSCTCQIIALLAKQRLTDDTQQRGPFLHRDTLIKVDRYIREHPGEDLSLKRLAEISNLDPTYLHKLYTSAYGRTPAQQALAHRILAARLALAEGELSVGEIASQCGFSSQAYFCSKFKKVMGKTPSQYRRQFRNKEEI
ncbi:MAG: helix-turn-helix transcriptional regulator [Oscillospiraceae bacterium]|nr:helix-turn-helix transcriptional regulator [Oscillospiraceae bacterium]